MCTPVHMNTHMTSSNTNKKLNGDPALGMGHPVGPSLGRPRQNQVSPCLTSQKLKWN